jgi:hypothetical protein
VVLLGVAGGIGERYYVYTPSQNFTPNIRVNPQLTLSPPRRKKKKEEEEENQ